MILLLKLTVTFFILQCCFILASWRYIQLSSGRRTRCNVIDKRSSYATLPHPHNFILLEIVSPMFLSDTHIHSLRLLTLSLHCTLINCRKQRWSNTSSWCPYSDPRRMFAMYTRLLTKSETSFLCQKTSYDRDLLRPPNCIWFGRSRSFFSIFKAVYPDTAGRVRVHRKSNRCFESSSGVCQRCPLPLFLFNLCWTSWKSAELLQRFLTHGYAILFDLGCANDIVCIFEIFPEAQSLLDTLRSATRYGLKFLPSKFKIMAFSWTETVQPLLTEGRELERVEFN